MREGGREGGREGRRDNYSAPRHLPFNMQACSCPLPHVVDPGNSNSFWFLLSLEFPFD